MAAPRQCNFLHSAAALLHLYTTENMEESNCRAGHRSTVQCCQQGRVARQQTGECRRAEGSCHFLIGWIAHAPRIASNNSFNVRALPRAADKESGARSAFL